MRTKMVFNRLANNPTSHMLKNSTKPRIFSQSYYKSPYKPNFPLSNRRHKQSNKSLSKPTKAL
jgi:hypothetical protein